MFMTTERAVLNWTRIGEWRDPVLDRALRVLVPEKDAAWLRSLPSPSRYCDDFSRLDPLVAAAGLQDGEELSRAFKPSLLDLFTHVRGTHLCRTEDVSSYRRRGLLAMQPKALQQQAWQHFKSTYPTITEQDFEQAVAKVPVKYREGRVFFGIDERFLIQHCSDYGVYGSEYILAIGRQLHGDGATDYCASTTSSGRA
jgi:hypothetical protein